MKHELIPLDEYKRKEAAAIRQFKTLLSQDSIISIKKDAKHIFKDKDRKPNLDLRQFNQVISVDTEYNVAAVEGMTTFYNLVDATLAFDLMPQAVPELRSITVGGAIAGLGGQSSSFKFGLVHEMISDFDLLTGEGKVIHCSPQSNPDLFYMLPNSYGSLGYVLRCTIILNKVSPYVKLDYQRFTNAGQFFEALVAEVESKAADFVEGVSFSPDDYILLVGSFTDTLPPNEITFVPLYEPFFKSIQDPNIKSKHLAIRDYIWRWDPDAFWATNQKNIFGSILPKPIFRRTIGPLVLRSDRLLKIFRFRKRLRELGLANIVFLESRRKESLIQDAAVPMDAAPEFDNWLSGDLQIYPIWYCPIKTTKPLGTYPLYHPKSELVLDFGFYISVDLEDHMDDHHYNLRIERKLVDIGGIKCLYSDTFYDRDQFWSIYDKPKYDLVKAKYDPDDAFLDLYDKVVT
ncbi:MAG TPA: FAD-binding oxidoreductase [candidate division Zixibacteria bacterium]|nr:FAD-binding oxidoreductase [candidate division Zixibacteria bacterium]